VACCRSCTHQCQLEEWLGHTWPGCRLPRCTGTATVLAQAGHHHCCPALDAQMTRFDIIDCKAVGPSRAKVNRTAIEAATHPLAVKQRADACERRKMRGRIASVLQAHPRSALFQTTHHVRGLRITSRRRSASCAAGRRRRRRPVSGACWCDSPQGRIRRSLTCSCTPAAPARRSRTEFSAVARDAASGAACGAIVL
jgi:hypothetical protein